MAVFIGSVEALGLLSDQLGLKGKFWDLIGSLNDTLTNFGFVVIGIFLGSWLVSTLIYRVKGYGDLQAVQQR